VLVALGLNNAAGSPAMLAFLGEAAAVSWRGNDNAQPHCAREGHFCFRSPSKFFQNTRSNIGAVNEEISANLPRPGNSKPMIQ
jgi:hypothetical protein